MPQVKIKVFTGQEISNLKSGDYFPIDAERTYFTFGGTDPKHVGYALKVADVLRALTDKGIFFGTPLDATPTTGKEKEKKTKKEE